jgi:hypothetical protein
MAGRYELGRYADWLAECPGDLVVLSWDFETFKYTRTFTALDAYLPICGGDGDEACVKRVAGLKIALLP